MQNRNNTPSSLSFGQIFERTAFTALAVSTFLYPLDVILNRRQMGYAMIRTPFAYNAGFFKGPLFSGWINSTKASTMKNSVVSNHEALSNRKPTEENTKSEQQNIPVANLIGISAGIGVVDSGLTSYHGNLKMLNTLGRNPKPHGFDRIRLWKLAYGQRASMNSLNALFCMTSSGELVSQAYRFLPPEKYANTGLVLGTVLSGTLSAVVTNPIGVIHTNRVGLSDPKTFAAPSTLSVTKKLLHTGGVQAFMRGAMYAMPRQTIAYGLINGIGAYYKRNSSLFFSAKSEVSSTTDLISKNTNKPS